MEEDEFSPKKTFQTLVRSLEYVIHQILEHGTIAVLNLGLSRTISNARFLLLCSASFDWRFYGPLVNTTDGTLAFAKKCKKNPLWPKSKRNCTDDDMM